MKWRLLVWIMLCQGSTLVGQSFHLDSPDGNLSIEVGTSPDLHVFLLQEKQTLLEISNLWLQLNGEIQSPASFEVVGIEVDSVNEPVIPAIREKSSRMENRYNEISISFALNRTVTFRLFDEGLAYRWSTSFEDSLTILSEKLMLHFSEPDSLRYQGEEGFITAAETPYEHRRVEEVESEALILLPVLVEKSYGPFIMITESDLYQYPGLWFRGAKNSSLEAVHPPFPRSIINDNGVYDFIARVEGKRSYPWRVFAVAEDEAALIDNHMVYLLASPSVIEDPSWIKPGVVAFDWWAKMNIYGADFKAGINTETAKYFIDFCASYGFQYFLFDDGWCPREDLLNVVPGLNMEEVTAYGRKKGVDILLWVHWKGLYNQFNEAFNQFDQWGISGIKMDFMNRDDQPMVEFIEQVAREAAKRKMVVNYHGVYKPSGLRRKYPNVLTREALIEFEYNGWTHYDTPEHHNILPYIRMFTGPMDYIPATMRNATPSNFRPVGDYPMGMGTRAHAMALFVILNSPMTMLPDAPSDYYREAACTEFIAQIPVEWDETKLLAGEIGKYTILARRNSKDWFVGGITNEKERSFQLATDFLGPGKYRVEFIQDGINAGSRANDYIKGEWIIYAGESLNLSLAPSGGWVAKISPVEETPNEVQ
jgi:alpha-glucosidase